MCFSSQGVKSITFTAMRMCRLNYKKNQNMTKVILFNIYCLFFCHVIKSKNMKSNIRLQQVHRRLIKTRYPKCVKLRRLCHISEKQRSLSLWANLVWKRMYDSGFKPSIDNTNPAYFEYFKELDLIEKMKLKLSKEENRIEAKGYFMKEALKELKQINAGRLSTSF